MILISLLYIFDFIYNDKFTYESYTFYNKTDSATREQMLNDSKINPLLDLTIHFMEEDKFAVFRTSIEDNLTEYNFKEKLSENIVIIFYQCGSDPNCASFNEFYITNNGK